MANINTPNIPTISFQNNPSTGPAGQIFTIPLSSASRSTLLTDLLSDLFDGSAPSTDAVIPLMIDRTSDFALAKVAAWLTHHAPAPQTTITTSNSAPSFRGARPDSVCHQPDDDEDLAAPLPAWDYALLDVPYPRLFEVMIAANYLGMTLLVRHAALVVGERVRGLTTEQIRRVLCVEDDCSREERRDIEQERGDV